MTSNHEPACSPPNRSPSAQAGRVRIPDLIKMLREDGWRLCAWHGGHRQYQHPVKRDTVTVSRTTDATLTRGALNSALKQAGVASDASA